MLIILTLTLLLMLILTLLFVAPTDDTLTAIGPIDASSMDAVECYMQLLCDLASDLRSPATDWPSPPDRDTADIVDAEFGLPEHKRLPWCAKVRSATLVRDMARAWRTQNGLALIFYPNYAWWRWPFGGDFGQHCVFVATCSTRENHILADTLDGCAHTLRALYISILTKSDPPPLM